MNIGCDIVKISRFSNWSEKWVLRYFGLEVFNQWIQRGKSVEYIASRWAMQEAIYKCCGIRESVVNDKTGKPISNNCAVSATHDDNMCWAIAAKL